MAGTAPLRGAHLMFMSATEWRGPSEEGAFALSAIRFGAHWTLCVLLAGCLQSDPAYLPVSLQPPYSTLPEAPAGATIEPGMPVKLDPRQQEAVIAGVRKWMKDPASVSFGLMSAARSRRGGIVVCGEVNGRNSAGVVAPMAPFVGMLTASPSVAGIRRGRHRRRRQASSRARGVVPAERRRVGDRSFLPGLPARKASTHRRAILAVDRAGH